MMPQTRILNAGYIAGNLHTQYFVMLMWLHTCNFLYFQS